MALALVLYCREIRGLGEWRRKGAKGKLRRTGWTDTEGIGRICGVGSACVWKGGRRYVPDVCVKDGNDKFIILRGGGWNDNT